MAASISFISVFVFSPHNYKQHRPESGESRWIPILPGFLNISICRKIVVKFQNYISMNLWADGYDKVNGNIFLPWLLSEHKKKSVLCAYQLQQNVFELNSEMESHICPIQTCYFRIIVPVHCESLQSLSTNKCTYYTKIHFTSSGCSMFRPVAILRQLTTK